MKLIYSCSVSLRGEPGLAKSQFGSVCLIDFIRQILFFQLLLTSENDNGICTVSEIFGRRGIATKKGLSDIPPKRGPYICFVINNVIWSCMIV